MQLCFCFVLLALLCVTLSCPSSSYRNRPTFLPAFQYLQTSIISSQSIANSTMPFSEHDGSPHRDLVLKSPQNSFSEGSRLAIPMWDSSDPDRAPPPLPMNPGSSSPKTRAGAAPGIQAATASLIEKTRENAPSSYTTNPMPLKSSPEKSLIKGQYHKRMHSLQPASDTRSEFRNYLDNRSPERPSRASLYESGDRSRDKSATRSGTSTSRDSGRESPSFHVSNRYLSKPILGENTPPSATMLALQNMQLPGENESKPLNISNPTPPLSSPGQSFDALSSQILSLTSIATGLQREMAQLSRRSKDNATDLLSLKAATNARDEDIRKSIRDLATNITSKFLDPEGVGTSSPSSRKSYTLPRVPSPGSFAAALERDLCGSPAPLTDGSASIALLEKVLREMATKEAQEKLLELVDEVKKRPAKDGADKDADKNITKMLEDILNLVKENPTNRVLVRSSTNGSAEKAILDSGFAESQSGSITLAQDTGLVTEDMVGILKRVKNSVAEGGGLTNEVKALVRELRGEVLGMGREIARKLEEASASRVGEEDILQAPRKEEIAEIVQTGLAELKEQMSYMIQEHQRELSTSVSRNAADSTEVYTAVKNAMEEFPMPQPPAPATFSVGMEKEDILEAVREAWETYKPEIELQNFGLERDEILECLSEGLKEYKPQHEAGVTYDQVLAAVQAGMHSFVPPPIEPQPSITKEEVIEAVKECLEGFELSVPEPNITKDDIYAVVSEALAGQNALTRAEDLGPGITSEDVVNVVTEGLAAHYAAAKDMSESNVTREDIAVVINEALASHPNINKDIGSNLTREDILQAISEGLGSRDSMTKEIELNKEDLFEAVTTGLHEAASSANFNVGEQVLERLQELVQGMKDEFKEYSAANGRDTEQVLDAMKDNLEVLRGEIESYVDKASDVTGKDEIIDTVKEGFRLLQADLENTINAAAVGTSAARGNPDTPELLDAMEKEFEHLRQTLSNLLIRSSMPSEKDEILDAIRDLGETSQSKGDNSEVVKTIKDEFENLRETIGMSLVKSEPSEKDEIIVALRESFETLQAETMQRRDGNESILSNTNELLDAFNDGVEAIRGDLERVLNKPDDGSSSEVLEILREGLASIKVEMEVLRESQKDFEETSTNRGRELMLANESSIGNDIESLKVLITQLQIKVEAIESIPPAPPPDDALKREHLDEVLAAVREVHGTVAEVGTREIPVDATIAKKDDTDAIENLLRNMKAKIDEMTFPAPDDIAKPEHILAVEALLSETKDAIAELYTRIETEGPTKAEVGTIETLLKDVWVAVDDLKNKEPSAGEDTEKVVKSDLQTVEAMIFELRTQIEELKLPDVETLPTKTEIQELGGLVAEFKEKVEAEAELTAQAFEARKVEHGGLAEKIEEAKTVINELQDELKSKLDGSQEGLSELKTLLEGLTASAESFSTAESIKEIDDLINREFERSRGEQEAAKLETEERDAAAMVKQDESRAAIIVDLGTKIDEKVGDILDKYTELHTAVDSKFSEIETRDVVNAETLTSTKSIAEDIKLVIGAMGDSVTETCELMSDDAKTYFNKVDESYNKMEAMHNELKEGQEQSKAELEKTSATTDRVETQILEYHPQILSTIKDILLIVGQHYEHSQKSAEELKTDLSTIPTLIPPLLPALPPPEPKEIIIPEKYDDTELHNKLDSIISHAESANKTMAHMDKLDEIHEKVMATSREVTDMVASQSRLLVEDYERKKRESEEAAYALEKRLAQKEKVEAEIVGLSEEKDSLLNIIQTLKQEKEELTKQNTKLSKELSGLETALEIRHEEMQVMEDRAETLERRILEGVLDHARSILLSRPGTSSHGMSLKRVSSYASTATKTSRASTASTAKDTRSLISSSVGMALKRRNPNKSSSNGSVVTANPAKERRILSLSHVTGNRGSTDRQLMLAQSGNGGLTDLKRSHSVKSNLPSRKTSWGKMDAVANKENETFPEEDEHGSGAESDTGTERRTSYTGTYTDSMMYGTDSTVSSNRHPSYSSSVNGLVAEHAGSILDEDDEDLEDQGAETREPNNDGDHQPTAGDETVAEIEEAPKQEEPQEEGLSELEPPPKLTDVPRQSDSGIGTDINSGISVSGE